MVEEEKKTVEEKKLEEVPVVKKEPALKEEPVAAQNKPYTVTLKKGETYYYCTCGRSKSQPFCDGSHNYEGSTFKPLAFTYEGEEGQEGEEFEKKLCGCKHNKPESGAFCDGSHKNVTW